MWDPAFAVSLLHSVHWGIITPPPSQKHHPPLFCQAPPKFANCRSRHDFSSLTPFHPLKVTKFLVRISQFESLFMTKKNISVYKRFLSLNTLYFSLFFT